MILPRTRYMWSVIATLIVVSCAVSVQDGYSRLRYGHRLDRKMIDSFCDYSLLDCVEACLSRKRCQSVSYLRGAEYCEINYEDKTTAPNRFRESSGWTYSERNDWDKAITGPCAFSNCEINETCRPLPLAKHECVLSDCGIPYIRGADMDSVDRWDGIAIGRRLHLQCLNQYKQIGSGRLLCSTDGQWIQDLICDWSRYGDHIYIVDDAPSDWISAEKKCRLDYGGYLAEIDSAEENSWILNSIMIPASITALWFGANDLDVEGEFTWSSSKDPLIYTNWRIGEPNDNNNNEDCAILKSSGWNDQVCGRDRRFICEKALK